MIESNQLKQNIQRQLWLLIALWFIGYFLAAITSTIVVTLNIPINELKETKNSFSLILNLSPNVIRLIQSIGSVVTFIVPVILFYFFTKINFNSELNYKRIPHLALISITILIILFSIPLIITSQTINLNMQLPDFLSGLEDWMFTKEDEANRLIVKILTMHTMKDLLINIIVIAVFPAVAEELFFRGVMQKLFSKLLKRPHLSIFITAAIFSFIHFQFYGFLPRMLLGIIFGYIFYWTNSIWYPIFAHLLYNGSQVIFAYILGDKFINADEPTEAINTLIIIFSTVIFFFFMAALQRLSKNTNKLIINDNGRLGKGLFN